MTMASEIPVQWLESWADADPDRTAIVTPEGEVSYRALADLVHGRAAMLSSFESPGEVIPIPVHLDLSSIVEVLAVSAIGASPLPYADDASIAYADPSSDAAVCLSTSGSSGTHKVVRLTTSNIESSVLASRIRLGNESSDRWLLCLPLNHVGGLSVLWRSLEAGGSVAVAPFDIALPRFMSVAQPTIASMVPTMVYRLLRADPDDLASLRFILVGGARTSSDLLHTAHSAGVSLVRSYGSTETTSQIATSEPGGDPLATHVGSPLDGVDVTIVDDDGGPVLPGVVGQISVSGFVVSPGYLGEPDRVGPLMTGDLGALDHSGRLTVHGRTDDRVVSGGENVFLTTVTDTVRSLSGVRDAVAVGLPDPEWGTRVTVVVASSRAVSALDENAREVLAPHEVPKQWVVVDEVPLLANGKHDLAAVRAIASGA